jgi:putative ABC transport system permease protein
MTAFAGITALLLVSIFLPIFDQYTECPLYIHYESPAFWACFIGFILVTGVLAGTWPAMVLSSFRPVAVLKGRMANVLSTILARKVLVVFQFSIAIVLIVSTVIVVRQLDYGRNRQVGYDRDRLLNISINSDNFLNHCDVFRSELLSSGAAAAVTETYSPLTENWGMTIDLKFQGSENLPPTRVNRYCESGGLVATTGMHLSTGRDIDLRRYPTDVNACLLNEAAVTAMQFKDPVGQVIKDGKDTLHVVGVVANYIQESPFSHIQPMLIRGMRPGSWMGTIVVRLNGHHPINQDLAEAEKLFRQFEKAYPFEYSFVDEDYAHKFHLEQDAGTIAALFAGLTIFISCLGLFGLAAYTAQGRIKEIGIRKVLGASIANISVLLSRDFVRLVALAILVAIPVSWVVMSSWLDNYEYHIPMTWDIFALSGAAAIFIALATVSYQTIKAALTNPVKNLRTE